MRTIAAAAVLMLLAACQTTPNVPEQVTVVVEKYRPLPAWATEPLEKPQPADGTVLERVRSEHARGVVIDLANCHRRLLAKLDRAESVGETECAK